MVIRKSTAFTEAGFDDSTTQAPPVRVRIKNLKQVDEELFDIEGITLQPIDARALCEALGRKLSDRLIGDIAELIFRHDVAEWLAQSIIRE